MPDLSGVWRYDTSQVIAAPASGYLRTTAAPISTIAISATTRGGVDVHANLLLLGSGADLLLQEVADATMAGSFKVTAATDHFSWVEYQVVPVASSATAPPRPNEDLLVNGSAVAYAHATYTTIAELQRVLQKPSPTAAELDAMNRVLNEAALEIDWELSISVDNPAPPADTADHDLLAEVNLARANELWNMEFRTGGLIPVPPDQAPIISPRDTWYRHKLRLLPLKQVFGEVG